MKLLKTLFGPPSEYVMRIADAHQPDLQPRYGGEFVVRGLNVFDRQGRFRGFVFEPGDPTPARIQSYVAGARQAGHIPEHLVRTLFAHIQREDFVVHRSWARDVLVFPSDIYQPSRPQAASRKETASRKN